LGQAAGIAAAQAVRAKIEVRKVPVAKIQAELTRQKGVIAYFEDVSPEHPAFNAIQFLGPRGLSRDFNATPDSILGQADAAERFARILKVTGKSPQGIAVTDAPLRGAVLMHWFKASSLKLPVGLQETMSVKKDLTVGDFAIAVAAVLIANS
jgi:hypothetical protein